MSALPPYTQARSLRWEKARKWLAWFLFVLVLVGVAVAVMHASFVGTRHYDSSKAAQSGVRNALVAAKTIFTDTDDYSTISVKSMSKMEPSLTYVPGGDSTGPSEISIATATTNTSHDTVNLTASNKDGNCFGVTDISASGTQFYTLIGSDGACQASDASGATATSW